MKRIITFDASQLNTFSECPLKQHYAYEELLTLPFRRKKAADMGTLVHLMLQLYYESKALTSKNQNEIAASVLALFDTLIDPSNYDCSKDDIKFLKQRFMQYILYYQGSRDFKALVRNGKASVEVGFSKVLYNSPTVMFIVEGKVDLLGEVAGVNCWTDHKTQGRAENIYKYKIQFLNYSWATRLPGMINYFGLQKEMTDKTFRREYFKVPEWKLKQYESWMMQQFWRKNAMIDADKIEQNLKACSGERDVWPCPFTMLCETEHPSLLQSIKDTYYIKRKRWSPWNVEETEETTA